MLFWFSIIVLSIWAVIETSIKCGIEDSDMQDGHRFLVHVAMMIITISCFAFVQYTHDKDIENAVSAAILKERENATRPKE